MAKTLPEDFRALTFLQPYAWAVAHAGKSIDNRTQPPPKNLIGQTIAIHAAKAVRADEEARISEEMLMRSKGEIALPGGACVLFDEVPRGMIVALATIEHVTDARSNPELDAQMRRDHIWWLGPVGIHLTDVVPLRPFKCDEGFHRGYWRVPDAACDEIERQLRAIRMKVVERMAAFGTQAAV